MTRRCLMLHLRHVEVLAGRALMPVFALLLAACAAFPGMDERAEEPKTYDAVVVAGHPLAAEAGREILEAGGSAADAAIAAELVLTLVEPQSSGIGGGAFLLHYDKSARDIQAYDGRETAPLSAGADLFLDEDGEPLAFFDAVVGGRAVGVPGFLRMAELAHEDHGRLPWAQLFEPAIRLAREGFEISPRLAGQIAEDRFLDRYPEARAYFYGPDGEPKGAGARLANPALAEVLETLAAEGAAAFYEGPIARKLVERVQSLPDRPGLLSLEDMAAYEAVRRPALCGVYRGYTACGMPPPTSGGATVLQILGILESFDLPAEGGPAPEALHLILEASRLAFADRNQFLADPDFVEIPLDRLLHPDYLEQRAGLISHESSLGLAEPGQPVETAAMPDQPQSVSTAHISVVDRWGNAVSMTASVEQAFGSRVMSQGFILNNQLTDFSFQAEVEGRMVANRVEPGKRPRSSMAPMIVFDPEGELALVTGSPGGSQIIGYVAQNLIAVLDWEMEIQEAVEMPHFLNRNGPSELEEKTALTALAENLRARGHEVVLAPMKSGVNAIRARPEGLRVGTDPRREGAAAGMERERP